MNIEDNYKEQILKIWDDFKDLKELNEKECEYRQFPISPKTVEKNSILFIGINPSFGKSKKVSDIPEKLEFYPKKNDKTKDIPYFEKFKEVTRDSNMGWTHLDLLYIRETNQKVIADMMKKEKGINFINRQLDISFDIIEKSNPKIIIVTNALAAEFFGKMKKVHKNSFTKIWKGFNLDFKKDFDNEIGTYRIPLNGKQVPIIFSGMLSGQRALDLGSLERLKWQINMILKKDNKN